MYVCNKMYIQLFTKVFKYLQILFINMLYVLYKTFKNFINIIVRYCYAMKCSKLYSFLVFQISRRFRVTFCALDIITDIRTKSLYNDFLKFNIYTIFFFNVLLKANESQVRSCNYTYVTFNISLNILLNIQLFNYMSRLVVG